MSGWEGAAPQAACGDPGASAWGGGRSRPPGTWQVRDAEAGCAEARGQRRAGQGQPEGPLWAGGERLAVWVCVRTRAHEYTPRARAPVYLSLSTHPSVVCFGCRELGYCWGLRDGPWGSCSG